MNLLLSEEETRTIKYLNQRYELHDEDSEGLTEKHHDQHTPPLRTKISQKHPSLSIEVHPHSKALVPDASRQPSSNPQRNIAKNKHKKGKSVDIEENVHCKEYKQEKGKGKVVIDAELLSGFRERGSISEMKQYNFSKKIQIPKKGKEENTAHTKRKKERSINQKDIIKVKKEIKSLMEGAPMMMPTKNKSSRSSRSNSNNLLSKGVRHKSHELTTDRRPIKSHRPKAASSELKRGDLKNIAQTMPITSKMVSLYSSSSSLFNSNTDLSKAVRRHSYVIPTEESFEEINEMRKYQSLTVRKRSSENLRKVSLINELIIEDEPKQRTQDIINHYLALLRNHQLELERQLPTDPQISTIPHQSSIRERNQELHSEDISYSQEKEEPLNREIGQQVEQLSKLNHIIDIIRKDSAQVDKQQVLQQIKSLIANNIHNTPNQQRFPQAIPHPLAVESPSLPREKDSDIKQSKNDLSTSELKDSIHFQESMQGLNLEILQRTLRQRESYLTQRKEKELQRLEDAIVKDQFWLLQRQRIVKWMDHQIKEVIRTRKQLWKGLTMVKGLLQDHQQRSTEIVRSLSDKYLAKSRPKKQQIELSSGRVNELQPAKVSEDGSSSINIPLGPPSEPSQDEQLLDSSRLKNEFEQYKKTLSSSQPMVNTKLEQHASALKEQETLLQPPAIGLGLNLQRIQCEAEFEDSLNSEQIEALAKESEAARGDSVKLPYALSVEEKEDIFEFIFLDLCIELTDEYAPDSPIMRRVAGFIRNMREQARKQKGFKTGTAAIRDYLFQFITFLKNKPQQLAEVHLNLDKPLGPTALDILKYMHVYDEEPPEEQASDTVFIMDIRLFQAFQQVFLGGLQFQQYYEDEEKEKKRRVFLKNAIHIHNKAVFDALNETLDRQRPYGVWGEPFSWKKSAKFYHVRDVSSKNSLILRSAQKTIEFAAYMCGFMADKEECNLRNNPNVTQAYIQQIRDDRLSRLLANELDQGEEKMLFIDDEETEILVELAQAILHNLLIEACRELF